MTGRHTEIYDLRVVVEEFRDLYCEDCAESSNVSCLLLCCSWRDEMVPRLSGGDPHSSTRECSAGRATQSADRDSVRQKESRLVTVLDGVANCRFHETRDQLFWQHRALGGVFG